MKRFKDFLKSDTVQFGSWMTALQRARVLEDGGSFPLRNLDNHTRLHGVTNQKATKTIFSNHQIITDF
jgi:hypothetical protein